MPSPRRTSAIFTNLRPASELVVKAGGADDAPSQQRAMVAVRESSEYDYELFDDMMRKVLERLVDRFPDLQPVVDVGSRLLMPGTDGDRLRRHFKVEVLYAPGARKRPTAYAVQREGIRVLLGLVSAGKATVDGGSENGWLTVVEEQVRTHQPSHFYTGPFARIVRNKDLAGGLKTAFKSRGTAITCFEWPSGFDMSEAMGDMAWELLAQAAHWDWIATLTRLQMGSLHHLKQGRYVRSERALPPGYERVIGPDGRLRVAPDPTKRHMVRRLIEVAAEDLDPATAVRLLSDVGFTTRSASKEVERLDTVKEPAVALVHLLQYLETYRTGTYAYWQRNTVPGCTSMLGLEVRKEQPQDMGFFAFDLDFGLPEGGWHDDQVIAAAIARRDRSRPKRGRSTEARKPLLGLTGYRKDGHEYRLIADDHSYALRRRVSESDATLGTAFDANEGEVVGRFATQRLHRVVADLLRQATETAPTDLPVVHDPAGELVLADDLERRAEAADARSAAGREQAVACGPDQADLAQVFRREAEDAMSEARALRAEAASRRASITGLSLGAHLQVDAQQLLVVAELLERTENLAAPEVCQAVRQVVDTLRIESQRYEPFAEIQLTARMHSTAGLLLVGPLTGTLQNTAGKRTSDVRDPARNTRLLHLYFTGADNEALRKLEGLANRAEKRRMSDALAVLLPHPSVARVLVDCPIPELRVAVLSPVFEEYGLSALPGYDDLDPTWVAEMQSVYLGDTWIWKHPTWATRDYTRQRQVLGWIGRHATTDGFDLAEVKQRLEVSDPELYVLLSADPAKYAAKRAGTWAPLEFRHAHVKHTSSVDGDLRLIRLRACPHCQSRTSGHLLRIPELPQGWICDTCRRAPGSPVVFPDAYLQPWAGSQVGTRQVRTADQIATITKSGTRLLPYRIPPYAGR